MSGLELHSHVMPLDELLRHESSFRRLARQMLAQFPTVRRWEETDDIVQDAAMRLHRALRSVTPDSGLHARRIAAIQIRRQLLDLARRYSRPGSHAANHDTSNGVFSQAAAETPETPSLEEWAEFHRCVEELPENIRETFELIWYGGLSQQHAAHELGISLRQIQRHWRTARILLHRELNPGMIFAAV